MWPVGLAVAGAWCVAVGAAIQERAARAVAGAAIARAATLLRLFGSPRWLLGGALTLAGVGAHLVALSAAPVTVVQLLGVSGLLIAVWLAARWGGRRLTIVELAGVGAVTLGLCGLVWTLPHSARVPAAPSTPLLIGLAVLAAVAAIVTPRLAARLGTRTRALLLAAAAGTCFGVGSALARTVVATVTTDLSVVWGPAALVAVAVLAVGGLLLQNAYRCGHFGLAYATLLITDPLVAAVIGVGVLGESPPTTPLAATVCLAAAAITVAGVLALARPAATIQNPSATDTASAVRRTDTLEENDRKCLL